MQSVYSLVALFLGFAVVLSDAYMGTVPLNPTLIGDISSYTGFASSTTHKDYHSHSDYLYHQTLIFWHNTWEQMEDQGVGSQVEQRAREQTEDSTVTPFTFLDLGGADGNLCVQALGVYPSSRCICVDLDYRFLEVGEEKYKHLIDEGRLRYVHAAAEATGLATGSIDLVQSQFVFQHQYNVSGVIYEMHRVLKPGGQFLIIDADPFSGEMMFPNMSPGLMSANRQQNFVKTKDSAVLNNDITLAKFLQDSLVSFGFDSVFENIGISSSRMLGPEHFLEILNPTQYYVQVRNNYLTLDQYHGLIKEFEEWKESVKGTWMMKSTILMWSGTKPIGMHGLPLDTYSKSVYDLFISRKPSTYLAFESALRQAQLELTAVKALDPYDRLEHAVAQNPDMINEMFDTLQQPEEGDQSVIAELKRKKARVLKFLVSHTGEADIAQQLGMHNNAAVNKDEL